MAGFSDNLEIITNIMPIEKDGKPCGDVSIIMAYLLANSVIKLVTINHGEKNYTIEYPTWINNYKQSTIDQLKKIVTEQLDIHFREGTPEKFIKKMLESKNSFIESVYDRENLLQKQHQKDKLLLINKVIKEMKVNKLVNSETEDCKFTIDFPQWLYSGKYNKSLVKEVTDMLTHQSIKSLSEITRLNYKSHSSNIDRVLAE